MLITVNNIKDNHKFCTNGDYILGANSDDNIGLRTKSVWEIDEDK